MFTPHLKNLREQEGVGVIQLIEHYESDTVIFRKFSLSEPPNQMAPVTTIMSSHCYFPVGGCNIMIMQNARPEYDKPSPNLPDGVIHTQLL